MKLPEEVRSRARLRPSGPLRERVHPAVVLGLVLLWLMLWGDVSVANVLSGLLLALVLTVALPLPPVRFGVRLRPVRTLLLLAGFFRDLVRSSVQVAWLALRPGPQPTSSVVRVPLHSHSDLFVAITAQVTSLVPGSVVVEVRAAPGSGEEFLYIHALGAGDARAREQARRRVMRAERGIMRALATPEALAAYEERSRADGTAQRCEEPVAGPAPAGGRAR